MNILFLRSVLVVIGACSLCYVAVLQLLRTADSAVPDKVTVQDIHFEAPRSSFLNASSHASNTTNERWAIVQVWDVQVTWYTSHILATNRALKNLGVIGHTNPSLPSVDHVIVVSPGEPTRACNNMPFKNNDDHELSTKAAALMLASGIQIYGLPDVSSFEAAREAAGVEDWNDLNEAFGLPERFKQFHSKLFMWNFTKYTRLVWMDADVHPLRSTLNLFLETGHRSQGLRDRCTSPVFMAMDTIGYCFNSGVTVLHPEQAQFAELMRELGRTVKRMRDSSKPYWPNTTACTKYKFESNGFDKYGKLAGDQDFVHAVFQSKGCIHALNPTYNTMVVSQRSALLGPNNTVNFVGVNELRSHLNWMLGTSRQRRHLENVHFGWPKPIMIIWKNDDRKDLGDGYFDRDSMDQDLSEVKLAYLSLFKTVWVNYEKAVMEACIKIKQSSKEVLLGFFPSRENRSCAHDFLTEARQSIENGAIKQWCSNPPEYGLHLHELWAVQTNSFKKDKRIKTWHEML